MHELGLAQGILEIARRYVPDSDAPRAGAVRVQVGQRVGVVVDSLVFCFEGITRGTPWENARLVVAVIPAVAGCSACRAEFPAEPPVFECPECGSRDLKLLAGDELRVQEIDLADEPAAATVEVP